MHQSSLEHMKRVISQYLDRQQQLTVIDIGSFDVNGSYKQFFDSFNWKYIGVDLEAGQNVDVVLKSPYKLPFKANSIDVVISGQAFEHIKFFWLTWMEMVRVLSPGGQIFLIAPSRGPEHRYPVDCWRFYPDGYRALAEYGGLSLVEVSTDWDAHPDVQSAAWGDAVGVFKKPLSHQLESTTKIQRLKKELRQTKEALAQAQDRITAMETSKFWQLRKLWFRVKETLRLSPNK